MWWARAREFLALIQHGPVSYWVCHNLDQRGMAFWCFDNIVVCLRHILINQKSKKARRLGCGMGGVMMVGSGEVCRLSVIQSRDVACGRTELSSDRIDLDSAR